MGIIADVTDAVVSEIGRAQAEARALGHGYIGTEHLVIVFSESEASRGAGIIRAQGVAPDDVRRELRRVFDENDWNRYVPDEVLLATVGVDLATVRAKVEAEFGEGALPMKKGSPGFTRRVKAILETASAACKARGDQKADIDDVFAALLADDDSVGVKILRGAGVDVVALRAALA